MINLMKFSEVWQMKNRKALFSDNRPALFSDSRPALFSDSRPALSNEREIIDAPEQVSLMTDEDKPYWFWRMLGAGKARKVTQSE